MSTTNLLAHEQHYAEHASNPPKVKRKLTGLHKAAVLLVSLSEQRSASVMKHLAAGQVETVSLEIAKLDREPTDPELTDLVRKELAEAVQAHELMAQGGIEYAHKVLQLTYGLEKAAEIMERINSMITPQPFDVLRNAPPEQLLAFLQNEAPQTIAMLLTRILPSAAAPVMELMEPEMLSDVAYRMAVLDEIAPEVIQEVAKVLTERFSSVRKRELDAVDGLKSLAAVLNHSSNTTEQAVISEIRDIDPEVAARLRDLLFTFEDVAQLEDRALQKVILQVDKKDLAIALRGATDEFRTRIFSATTERIVKDLTESLEFDPPQRKSAVDEARSKVVAVVRRLEADGDIHLGREAEEDLV